MGPNPWRIRFQNPRKELAICKLSPKKGLCPAPFPPKSWLGEIVKLHILFHRHEQVRPCPQYPAHNISTNGTLLDFCSCCDVGSTCIALACTHTMLCMSTINLHNTTGRLRPCARVSGNNKLAPIRTDAPFGSARSPVWYWVGDSDVFVRNYFIVWMYWTGGRLLSVPPSRCSGYKQSAASK